MVRHPAALLAVLLLVAPALAGAETLRIRVKGVGELYGEVEEQGGKLTVTTITGEKHTYPRAQVLSVDSLAEPGGLEPATVVDAAPAKAAEAARPAEAASPAQAPRPAEAKPPAEGNAEALAAVKQRIKDDPAVLAELAAILQDDPGLRDALSDPALMQAVASGDTAAAERSPSFSKISGNARIQALVKRLAGSGGP